MAARAGGLRRIADRGDAMACTAGLEWLLLPAAAPSQHRRAEGLESGRVGALSSGTHLMRLLRNSKRMTTNPFGLSLYFRSS